MQNTINYWRLVAPGGYRFIGTSGFTTVPVGMDSFEESVVCRTTLPAAGRLFPYGKAHPNATLYPDFYSAGFTGGSIFPEFAGDACVGSVRYEGVMDLAKRSTQEEWGLYIDGKFFDSYASVPGRPAAVSKTNIGQAIPSYRRTYLSATRPAYQTVDSTGKASTPANFNPPTPPAALISWASASLTVYNYPWGWVEGNRTIQQIRLSTGTTIPLYQIQETYLYKPAVDLT